MIPSDERMLQILVETRTIAMVGASTRPDRDSHRVGEYLVAAGFNVIPVNPTYAGEALFGTTVRASLSEIDEPVEMLNLFRRSDHVREAVDEALAALPGLKSVWMQLGVSNAEARAAAEAKGIAVVENRCLMVEHRRLMPRRV